jgi:hypothetical protein
MGAQSITGRKPRPTTESRLRVYWISGSHCG